MDPEPVQDNNRKDNSIYLLRTEGPIPIQLLNADAAILVGYTGSVQTRLSL